MINQPIKVYETPFNNRPIEKIYYREGTADWGTLNDVRSTPYHLPPLINSFSDPLIKKVFLDLGSHVGYTVLDFCTRFPNTYIDAYEADRENFEMLEKNVYASYNIIPYINMFNGVVSTSYNHCKRAIPYMGDTSANNAYAFQIQPDFTDGVLVIGIDHIIKTSLARHKVDSIDFIKMDIEGAENDIFLNDKPDWLWNIRSINVELHYAAALAKNDICRVLHKYDLDVVPDQHHGACILGFRWPI
jgi:FkbM family methyltransferase